MSGRCFIVLLSYPQPMLDIYHSILLRGFMLLGSGRGPG